MTSLKPNDFQKLANIHHLDTPVSNNKVKTLEQKMQVIEMH